MSIPPLEERARWLTEARFGLFVHWGLYSAAARHEWVQTREKATVEEYRRYFDHFSPDRFDPERWASDAWAAGMRYVVVTTKHHDGFCLWDSKLTDYSAPHTPAGRDLLAPMVAAFRARGFRIGFYHSLLDWHHPDFTIDDHHPLRDTPGPGEGRDMSRYVRYLHGQVTELLTGYGRVDSMWFDFSYPGYGDRGKGREDWRSEELMALVRRLQPGILVNDRLDLGTGPGPDTGDFTTPEQVQPVDGAGFDSAVPWEACQTLNGSWGYDRDNTEWKSPRLLIGMLIDTVAKGGNLLLNVGPTGRGAFDPHASAILSDIGEWMDAHHTAIHGAGPAEFTPPPDCRFTRRADRLYLHVLAWPLKHLHLPGLAGRVRYARLLHDHSEVRIERYDPADDFRRHMAGLDPDTLTLRLPVRPPEVTVPVVELILAD
ncbi:alpha-L-fucosidase [Stackebrandtia albiflava]|uniref:alpha-L-fucosidase n=1 Tax=Stackebrandtia albiflava TaxID=406432 RepID=A0A562VH19_9ACTN|nr:alpha-L-fucosidase [Stackebrandtia albiflava]TWJ17193.1 alpha-L-fucosidase [Stackebrandtia albiflava]